VTLITQDERRVPATVVTSDENQDLAVLRPDGPVAHESPAVLLTLSTAAFGSLLAEILRQPDFRGRAEPVLKAVCGHESVSGAVPIEFDILFTPI